LKWSRTIQFIFFYIMKKNISLKPLSGFVELLPDEQMLFNSMFDTIRSIYESFGFIPLETPILERTEVLLAKAGGETEKQIYRFNRGKTDLTMRFDLTVPLARYVANNHGKLVFPFRRYAMGKVFRGERPQAGRFREFYQCDIDIIGFESLDLRYDAEIPSVIYSIFKKLGFEKFTIRVNNRKILNGLFNDLEITGLSNEIMQVIDKIEKIGLKAVRDELVSLMLSSSAIDSLLKFIAISGDSKSVLSQLADAGITDDLFLEGVSELSDVVNIMKELGIPESNFIIDLTIARGLDYYTGTVYETRLDDYEDIGSVCSGGRYDDLASQYLDKKLPGVGISIGLSRLFDQLLRKNVISTGQSTPTQALIVPMTEDLSVALNLASELRNNDIATEISFVSGKMKKRLSYADRLRIPYVIFIGEDEIASEKYTLKSMKDGKQLLLSKQDLLRKLK